MDWLGLVLRWVHILAAITAAGGAIFWLWVLLPALAPLAGDERAKLQERLRSKWAKIIGGAILLLLVSGGINFFRTMPMFKPEGQPPLPGYRLYNIAFGIKFLLAMVVFFLASALAGRSAAFDKIRANAKFWLGINVLLIVIIVCLSGVLRSTHILPASAPTGIAVDSSANAHP